MIVIEESTVNLVPTGITNLESVIVYGNSSTTQWEQSGHTDSGATVRTPIGNQAKVYNVADEGFLLLDFAGLTAGLAYTASIYVLPNQDYTFRWRWNNIFISQLAQANKWTRLVNTQAYSGGNRVLVGYRDIDGAANPNNLKVAYCMAQLEQKSYASSYVCGSRNSGVTFTPNPVNTGNNVTISVTIEEKTLVWGDRLSRTWGEARNNTWGQSKV